jgi:3-hydroxyisobutyrate dehydrogenase
MTNHTTTTQTRAAESRQQLSFLGMGAMGSSLAARLLDAGYPLTVYDRTAEHTQPLVQRGARFATTPAEAAVSLSIVLSCLADDTAVEAVLLGPHGASAAAHPGTTFIEMSTILPTTSRTVAVAAQERGLSALDAAISGSTPQAEAGTLVLLVGGEQTVYDRCLSILSTLGQRSSYMGPSGMGTTMKLVVNTLLGVGIQVRGEAAALGEKAGLDKERLLDVLGQTAVIALRQKLGMENVRLEQYPVTFALQLMHKDFGLILREAESLHIAMPVTAAAEQLAAVELASQGGGDITATIRWMEELAGVIGAEGTVGSAEAEDMGREGVWGCGGVGVWGCGGLDVWARARRLLCQDDWRGPTACANSLCRILAAPVSAARVSAARVSVVPPALPARPW